MRPATIAHVLSSFGMGGQERVALELARRQAVSGHRVLAVSLATGAEGPLAASFRSAGVTTGAVPKHGPSLDPSLPVRLARLLRDEGVDVVHTHNPHALIYGAPAASISGAVTVHSKHGLNPDSDRRRWLRRTAARFADAYVAVTESLADVALDKRECSPSSLHVIANGVDVERFQPNSAARRRIRHELGIPDDAWVVGTVGRLAPEKNQGLLLHASTPLLDQLRHLVLVGDGPERASLEALTEGSPGREFVHFTGARDDVAELLTAFDVFALTSHSEGLPLVVLEAMASGVPVLTTAVGGLPDVIEEGVTGYLIPPGDPAALMAKLTWLASRPAQAALVARSARTAVSERYSLERMATEYEALYEQLLADRRAAAAVSVGARSA